LLADRDHDHVGISEQIERNLLVELHGRTGEVFGGRPASEVEVIVGAAVQEDLDPGYSQDGRMALFHFSIGPEEDHPSWGFSLLRKASGRWSIIGRHIYVLH
jgi:hypothetical protein